MREETKSEKKIFLFFVMLGIVFSYLLVGMWYGADTVNKKFEKEIAEFKEGTFLTEKGGFKKWNYMCVSVKDNKKGNYITCTNKVFDKGIVLMKMLASSKKTQFGIIVLDFNATLKSGVEIYCETASYVAIDFLWLYNWLKEDSFGAQK